MSRSTSQSLSLTNVLKTLCTHHDDLKDARFKEFEQRKRAYDNFVEEHTEQLKNRREEFAEPVENDQGEIVEQPASDSYLRAIATREASEWGKGQFGDEDVMPRWEGSPLEHAVQVLIRDHHFTVQMEESSEYDFDDENPEGDECPVESLLCKHMARRRLSEKGWMKLKGSTELEAELRRLDTPKVVQSLLRDCWKACPQECEGMRLPKPVDAASVETGNGGSTTQAKPAGEQHTTVAERGEAAPDDLDENLASLELTTSEISCDVKKLLDVQAKRADEPAGGSTKYLEDRLRQAEQQLNELREKETRSKDLLLHLAGELTPAEYRIVKYAWNGQPVSFEELFRECWDKPIQPDSQRTTIKRLSVHLEEINARVWIETSNAVLTLHRPDK